MSGNRKTDRLRCTGRIRHRIESQMNQYLVASDFMKNVVESGYVVTDNQFAQMATLLQDEEHVIEAFELAKDGLVSPRYIPWREMRKPSDLTCSPSLSAGRKPSLPRKAASTPLPVLFELVQGGTEPFFLTRSIWKMHPGKKPSGDFPFWF